MAKPTLKIVATWDAERLDETKVTVTGFDDEHWIAKVDFLQDVIEELEIMKEAAHLEGRREAKRLNRKGEAERKAKEHGNDA